MAIIFIDGFLTEEKKQTNDWELELQKIYPNNPWYCVKWQAENLKAIGKQIGFQLGSRLILARAVSSTTPLGLSLTAIALLNNAWSKAYTKAKKTGELLGKEIVGADKNFILFGHSLGARVIYFTLDYLVQNNRRLIQDVHLLGGAVDNKKEHWKSAKKGVYGSINNYTSQNDKILSRMYTVGTAFTSKPIGIYNIETEGIRNIDVSHIVNGHTEYKKNLSKIIYFSFNN